LDFCPSWQKKCLFFSLILKGAFFLPQFIMPEAVTISGTNEEQWLHFFDPQAEALEEWRLTQGNAFFSAALYGQLNTVSPDYALEILHKPREFSLGLGEFLQKHQKDLVGFYNGMPELGDHQSRSSSAVFPFFRTEQSYKRHKKILLNHYLKQKGQNPPKGE
jgi:glycogen synthase